MIDIDSHTSNQIKSSFWSQDKMEEMPGVASNLPENQREKSHELWYRIHNQYNSENKLLAYSDHVLYVFLC